jgi:hypothetical protein
MAFVLDADATVTCAHGGRANPTLLYERVRLSGRAVITTGTQYGITGCSLSGSGTPPCATGHFTTGAARVRAGGFFLATTTGYGVAVPTASPMTATMSQTRVRAM